MRGHVDISATYRFPTAGELKKKVTFHTRIDVPAGNAETGSTYEEKYTTWGKLSPVGETIRIGSEQINKAITHRVVVRYRKQLYKSNQLIIDGFVYRIKGVSDVNSAGRFLMFSCEELGEEKREHRHINRGWGEFE